MKIGITGATGFIGSHLTEELVRRGHSVRCFVRPTSNLRWIRALPVTLVRGSLTCDDNLPAFLRDLDILIHTAGSKFAPTRRDFARSNETLTCRLLDAVERLAPGLRRFVYLSSVAVTGPSPEGHPLTEDAPPNPITRYGVSKLRTEGQIASRSGRIDYTILRPPGVYGPRDGDILPVFRMARFGIQLVIGRRNTVDLVYVGNLVDAICLTIDSPAARNRTYHVTDEVAYTWDEFTHHIHRALGRRALTVTVPGPLLTAAGWVSQRAASWVGGEVKLNDEKIRELKAPYWRVSSERARTELGYRPRVGVDEAIAETLRWYRTEGWL